MTTGVHSIRVGPECAGDALREAAVRVKGAESEVVLDLSAMLRIDGNVVTALEELAGLADDQSVKVVLRGVNVDVYRVLKQLGLAQRFVFPT